MDAETNKPPLILRFLIGLTLTLWALPVTIWSLLGALVFWLSGSLQYKSIQTHPRLPYTWAIKFYVRPQTWPDRYMANMLQGKFGGAKGAANGHVIAFRPATITPEREKAILLHELRHTWQFMWLGILQPIFTVFWNLTQRPRLGILGAYYTNPLEKDAYFFSGEKSLWEKRLKEHLRQN